MPLITNPAKLNSRNGARSRPLVSAIDSVRELVANRFDLDEVDPPASKIHTSTTTSTNGTWAQIEVSGSDKPSAAPIPATAAHPAIPAPVQRIAAHGRSPPMRYAARVVPASWTKAPSMAATKTTNTWVCPSW